MVQCFFALFLFPLLIQSSEYQFILPTQISSNIQDNGTQENLLFKEKNSVYTYIKKSTGGWIETPFSNWSAAFHYDLKDDFLFGISYDPIRNYSELIRIDASDFKNRKITNPEHPPRENCERISNIKFNNLAAYDEEICLVLHTEPINSIKRYFGYGKS